MKFPLWKRFTVWLNGRAKIELRLINNKPAWFYLAKCRKHGYFTDSLHGHKGYMNCPQCLDESSRVSPVRLD
mgnify:CR=1 FL=1